MQPSRGTGLQRAASPSATRAVALVIALVNVALLAYGYPWQLVVFLALVGAALVAAAYPVWRRAQTLPEMVVISCIGLSVYAVLIIAISAAMAE